MTNGWLQLFLLINAALIGAAITIGVRHALAHFRPHKHDADKHIAQQAVKLPPEVKQRLLEQAEKNYQKILDGAASQLQLDLSKTTQTLNKELDSVGRQIVEDEMKRYKASLDELQRSTESAVSATQVELEKHGTDLKATMVEQQKTALEKMEQEVEAEKARRIAMIDSRLADAAASFLIETMGHDIDLGAQLPYLTKMIEEHKDAFKQEVDDGSVATK